MRFLEGKKLSMLPVVGEQRRPNNRNHHPVETMNMSLKYLPNPFLPPHTANRHGSTTTENMLIGVTATLDKTSSHKNLCKISHFLHLAEAARPGGRRGRSGEKGTRLFSLTHKHTFEMLCGSAGGSVSPPADFTRASAPNHIPNCLIFFFWFFFYASLLFCSHGRYLI